MRNQAELLNATRQGLMAGFGTGLRRYIECNEYRNNVSFKLCWVMKLSRPTPLCVSVKNQVCLKIYSIICKCDVRVITSQKHNVICTKVL
jgi:hypothetical protein